MGWATLTGIAQSRVNSIAQSCVKGMAQGCVISCRGPVAIAQHSHGRGCFIDIPAGSETL